MQPHRDLNAQLLEETESESPRTEVIAELLKDGADINYQDEDDWCALADACLSHNVELVEWLLTKGANPNVIVERSKSILNLTEDDDAYHEMLSRNERDGGENHAAVDLLRQTEKLLMDHGAKTFSDIITDRVERWVQVFASDVTGLCSLRGHLRIEQIPGVSRSLADQFNSWHASNWDPWPREDGAMAPAHFNREEHNAIGLRLSKYIKELLGSTIEVAYLYVDAEFEKRGKRSVNRETVS